MSWRQPKPAAANHLGCLAGCERHSDVTGPVSGPKAHQHAIPLVGARGLERLVNVTGIRNASSGDFQDRVAILESPICSGAIRVYLRDNDPFLACAAYLACRGNRQAQTRYARAMRR